MNDLLIERVLRAAECVPAGRAATYGQLAELVGTGPRQVGAIMSRHGGSVPWWRVVNAKGMLPPGLTQRAADHWRREGTPMRSRDAASGPDGVVLSSTIADPDELEARYREATADLPPIVTS